MENIGDELIDQDFFQKKKWKTLTHDVLVIIPAAGSGNRFGPADLLLSRDTDFVPKQYANLNGHTILERTVKTFLDSKYVSEIVIAIDKWDDQIEHQNSSICITPNQSYIYIIPKRSLKLIISHHCGHRSLTKAI